MKKLTIQSLAILINNKEKINILCLENKNEKYILYSNLNFNENEIDSNLFEKMEFSENMQITPKKKFNDLKLTVDCNLQDNVYKLLWNNKNIYYLKNSKNIIINNDQLKLILYDGNLLNNNDTIEIKTEKKSNLVDDLLSKNANNNFKTINFKEDLSQKNNKKNIEIEENENNKMEENNENTTEEENNQNNEIDNVKTIEFNDNIEINKVSKETENIKSNEVNNEIIQDNIQEDNNIGLPIEMLDIEIKTEKKTENISTIIHNNIENKINDIVTDIVSFKMPENIQEINLIEKNESINEKIKTITKSINDEKIDLNNKKNDLENEVFNLENILSDFNKLFSFIDIDKNNKNENKVNQEKEITNMTYTQNEDISINKNINIHENTNMNTNMNTNTNTNTNTNLNSNIYKNMDTNMNKNSNINTNLNTNLNTNNINRITPTNSSTITNKSSVSNNNTINLVNKNKVEDKKILQPVIKNQMNNIPYTIQINYQNINYKISTIKLTSSNDLNFSNVFSSKVSNENIISKLNLAFELDKDNSSYLFSILNQKHLINKINNSIVLTNLTNRTSQIIKNKENFKIITLDYILLNDCTLIVPVTNKKIFDNNYGTSYNLYVPKMI